MSTSSDALTSEVLDRFREMCEKAGASLAHELRPAWSADAMERLLSPLGLDPSPELRTLWGWGVAPDEPTSPGSWGLHPEFELLPPAEAVSETETARSLAPPSTPYPPGWLAFARAGGSGRLLVDCADRRSSAPVYYESDGHVRVAAPSLGALIRYWTEQIVTGESEFSHGRWWADDDARPPWIVGITEETS